MSLPGPRYVIADHRVVVDTHRLLRGWLRSSEAEREAAVVYVQTYGNGVPPLESWWHLVKVCDDFNTGRRSVV